MIMGVNQVRMEVNRINIGLVRVKMGVNRMATYPPTLSTIRDNEFGDMF